MKMSISEQSYLNSRLNDQIEWYDNKSSWNQRRYKSLKITQITLSTLIPFLASLVSNFSWVIYLIGSIGVLVTVLEGFLNVGKYHENWVEYRSISEMLKHEKYMYLGRAGVYSENDELNFLVERVETIVSKENINWANLNYGDNGGTKKNG